MPPGIDAARWQRVRQQLMPRWPSLLRALPERLQIVTQGVVVGLSDRTVVVRADWLTDCSMAELRQAQLHLAAHAALGHRPWRRHPVSTDPVLDRAAGDLLRTLGVDDSDADWHADHHGTWPNVRVQAPGETWAVQPKARPAHQADTVSAPARQVSVDPQAQGAPEVQEQSAAVSAGGGDPPSSRQRVAGSGDAPRHPQRGSGTPARLSAHRAPQTDWRVLLRLWLLQRSYQRWQFDRPARRQVAPFILPRLAGRQLHLAVALDISGSIDPLWFEAFFREIEMIRGLVPLRLRVLTCDNRIHEDRPIQGAVVPPPFEGGGGTDFRPVFERLAGDAALDGLIYCTDLLGEYPKHPPRFPVFWLVPDVLRAASVRPSDPPFGQVLSMDTQDGVA